MLRLVAAGLSNQEIATALAISEHTHGSPAPAEQLRQDRRAVARRRHRLRLPARPDLPHQLVGTDHARVRGAWYARSMTPLPVVRTVTSGRQSRGAIPTDEFGEVGLRVFVGARRTWCHTEAPSPEAVRRSHQALGIDLDPRDVALVQVLP